MIYETLSATIEDILKEFPKFKILKKSESWLMKTISKLLFFISFGKNQSFMINFITTIGNTVYVPDGWDNKPEKSGIEILMHERIHMRQSKKLTPIIYSLAYLFFPIPVGFAWARAKLEWEAYAESMRVKSYFQGIDSIKTPEFKEYLFSNFTGPSYLFMMPFRSVLEKWYKQYFDGVESP
jgi:hypothetical protein